MFKCDNCPYCNDDFGCMCPDLIYPCERSDVDDLINSLIDDGLFTDLK